MTANIRRGTMVPKVEPRGADSHSILSINLMEGGVECMDYAVGVGSSLHHHKTRCEINNQNLLEVLRCGLSFSVSAPIYPRSTITRLPFGQHISGLWHDSILLRFRPMVGSNYVLLLYLESKFCCFQRTQSPK